MLSNRIQPELLMVCLTLILSCQLTGQVSNYISGKVMLLGEERTGYINLLDNVLMTRNIQFKSSIDDKNAVNYSPQEVSSFVIGNQELTYETVQHSFVSDMGDSISEKRFALLLFEGTQLSLLRVDMEVKEYDFRFNKHPGYIYYLADHQAGKAYKLEIKEEVYSETKYRKTNAYRGALKYLLRADKETSDLIAKTRFDNKSLIKLLKNYHTNQGLSFDVKQSEKTKRVKKVLLLGGGIAPVSLQENVNQRFGYLAEVKYDFVDEAKRFPAIQIGIDYMSMDYSKVNWTGMIIRTQRIFEGFEQFRLNLGLRKELYRSKHGLSLNLRGGVHIGVRGFTNLKETLEEFPLPNGTAVIVRSGLVSENTGKGFLGLNLGLGAEFRLFVIDFGVETIGYDTEATSFLPVLRFGRLLNLGKPRD